jgi:hypothetical protein
MMNLQELKARGGFVSSEPVKKSVTWKHETADGQEIDDKFYIYVVRQSFGSVEKLLTGINDRSKTAAFISACVRFMANTDEAKEYEKKRADDPTMPVRLDLLESMSYEDAYQLEPSLAGALVVAINDVNGEQKNSLPPMNSGTK